MRTSSAILPGLVLLLSVLLAAPSSAQTTVNSPNAEPGGGFGGSISTIGDVNSDGHEDYVVGASGEDPGTAPSGAGRAYILSGADDSLVRTLASPNQASNGGFGEAVAGVGDVNGDSVPDILVGARFEDHSGLDGAGYAYVFSGADGSLLYALTSPNAERYGYFGSAVASAGDVDDDGTPDVLVGASGETSPTTVRGRVYVYSGATGSVLQTPTDQGTGAFYVEVGSVVASAGDVNADGHDDVLVSARDAAVFVYSGAEGTLLYSVEAPVYDGRFGYSVAPMGDLDGDGRDDFAVGAYSESAEGLPFTGRVYFFSGVDGSPVRTVLSPNAQGEGPGGLGSAFGDYIAAAGDVDGDGTTDLDVSAPFEAADGRVYTISGATGAALFQYDLPEKTSTFGRYSLARIRSAGGPITSGLLVGADHQGTGGQVLRFAEASITPRTLTITGVEGWHLMADLGYETLDYQVGPLWTQGMPGGDVTEGAASLYRYDPTRVFEFQEDGWYVPSLTDATRRGSGFQVYVFEDDDRLTEPVDGGFPKTLSGTVAAEAPFALSLGFRDDFIAASSEVGWNLMGNPYADSLDWDQGGWTKTNVDNAIYVYDAATQTYLSWNGTTGSLGSGRMPLGAAFWAKANAASPALTAPGSIASALREDGLSASQRRAAPRALPLTVSVALADSVYAAEAYVLFDAEAAADHDRLDAYALAPHVATYAALFTQRADTATLAIDARPTPQPDAPQRLPLDVWAVADGELTDAAVTLSWPDLSALPADWTLMLEDTHTGTTVDLREADAYTFETAVPPGGGAQRSAAPTLVASAPPDAGPGVPPTPRPLDRAASRYAATLNAAARDGSGAAVRSAASRPARFVLHVTASTATADEPAALPSAPQALAPAYPNPTAGLVRLAFELDAARPVHLAVYDALGRLVATLADGPHAAGRHTTTLDTAALPAGLYIVRLSSPVGLATTRLTVVR